MRAIPEIQYRTPNPAVKPWLYHMQGCAKMQFGARMHQNLHEAVILRAVLGPKDLRLHGRDPSVAECAPSG
jgi:hypothetical protein